MARPVSCGRERVCAAEPVTREGTAVPGPGGDTAAAARRPAPERSRPPPLPAALSSSLPRAAAAASCRDCRDIVTQPASCFVSFSYH